MIWTLVIHLLGVIMWMGSLLILTRLLAYQASEQEAGFRARLGTIGHRLYWTACSQGMLLTLVTGVVLIFQGSPGHLLRQGWLHGKLLFVVLLVGTDQFVRIKQGQLNGGRPVSSRLFTALHFLVTFLLLGVLAFVFPGRTLL